MSKKVLYKYINLLFRVVIGLSAVIYIYCKVEDDWIEIIDILDIVSVKSQYLLFAIILVFFNWGIEALKWRYAIRKTIDISWLKAFSYTLTGITASLITPNRIGEIPFRALMLGKEYFKVVTLKTVVSSFSQLLVTIILGSIGLYYTYNLFSINFNSNILAALIVLFCITLTVIYFRVRIFKTLLDKVRYFRKHQLGESLESFHPIELFLILLLSLLRYIVFTLQYALVFYALGINLFDSYLIMLIPVFFIASSVIPTILISEIMVRMSVAIFVFGLVSDQNIVIMTSALILWIINVAFPALLGLFNLKELKILNIE